MLYVRNTFAQTNTPSASPSSAIKSQREGLSSMELVAEIFKIIFSGDSSTSSAIPKDSSVTPAPPGSQPIPYLSVSPAQPGSPPDQGGKNTSPTCPIMNPDRTCGSRSNAIRSCAHCTEQYILEDEHDNPDRRPPIRELCKDSYGTPFALDIAASPGTTAYLPSINNHLIEWEFLNEEKGSSYAIQKYIGTDKETGDKYYIQFHHTRPGSGNPGIHTTDSLNYAGIIDANHLHVQLAQGTPNAGGNWVDATQYLCK
ncbi:MAG: hypothetical protein Q7S61_06095 [bacterium]|nr:hypothetical protein [bacterium]